MLTLSQTAGDIQEFNRTNPNPFGTPEITHTVIPIAPAALPEHQTILHSFAEAVLQKAPDRLIAPGVEGVIGLELGNAIQIAALTRVATTLPLADGAFETFLTRMIREYGGRKPASGAAKATELSVSFPK